MKYFVDMLCYVMEHTVCMWGTVHITKHDHTDVKNAQKHCFYNVFAGIIADIIM